MTEPGTAGPTPPGDGKPPGAESGGRPVVVVIEDEPQIRRFLRPTLTAQGYHLVEAATAEDGILQAATRQPDVVILDLGLPDMDGLEVIRRLREWTAVPIIVLSARGQEPDKIAALDMGADDYVAKPFGVGELLARMRVALRHATPSASEGTDSVFTAGNIRVELARRRVLVGEREVHLTRTEYRLLTTLIRHAGKVLTHRQLLKEVWGPAYAEQTHYLRVYMAQLRQKLEADSARPRFLLTEPGVGDRLVTE
jgi:two-component system KDP operon response regulator KdpE